MNDTPPADSTHKDSGAVDLGQILDLNFVPDWARSAPGQQDYADYQESRGPRRAGRDDRRGPRVPRSAAAGQPMPRRGGSSASAADRPRPDRGGDTRPYREGRDNRPQRDPFPPAPTAHRIDISFIPERHQLGVLARKVRSTHRAYPLSKLAELLASKPEFCEVKIESLPPAEGQRPEPLFQCKETRATFLTEDAFQNYVLREYLDVHYERIEEEVESPKGVFNCVGRCGRTGELLGPPNYHTYNARVREIWQARFPDLSLDEYSRRIELVHDAELVEQWKQQCSRRTVYRSRSAGPEAPALDWAAARAEFLSSIAPKMLKKDHRAIVPQSVIEASAEPWLKRLVQDSFAREQRHPLTLLRALRPALRHMGMAMFRPGGRDTYITPVAPHPIDPAHAVDNIHAVLEHLRAHPGCTRDKLLEHLCPGCTPGSDEAGRYMQPLGWLIERGNVIEFFNGALAVPGAAAKS